MKGLAQNIYSSPVGENVDEGVNQPKLSAHEVGVADLLVQAFVIELNDPVDRIAEHGL